MAGFKVAASRPGDLSNAHSKQNSDRDRVGGRAQHRRRVRFRGGRSGCRRYEAGDNDGRTRRQGHDGARRYDDDSGDKVDDAVAMQGARQPNLHRQRLVQLVQGSEVEGRAYAQGTLSEEADARCQAQDRSENCTEDSASDVMPGGRCSLSF
jgi:hypothetical protein